MEPGTVAKIQAILSHQEESILSYATQRYLALPELETVGFVEDHYAELARDKDVTMYVYVVDSECKLSGVLDIKEVLLADNSQTLGAAMNANVVSFETTTTLRQANEDFIRYGFRAIPLVDEEHRILGVIPSKDVMNLKYRCLE